MPTSQVWTFTKQHHVCSRFNLAAATTYQPCYHPLERSKIQTRCLSLRYIAKLSLTFLCRCSTPKTVILLPLSCSRTTAALGAACSNTANFLPLPLSRKHDGSCLHLKFPIQSCFGVLMCFANIYEIEVTILSSLYHSHQFLKALIRIISCEQGSRVMIAAG